MQLINERLKGLLKTWAALHVRGEHSNVHKDYSIYIYITIFPRAICHSSMILSSTVLCEFQAGRLLLCAIKGLLSTSNGHLPNMTCFAGELAERYVQDVRKNVKVNISLHRPKVTKTTSQNHQNTNNS